MKIREFLNEGISKVELSPDIIFKYDDAIEYLMLLDNPNKYPMVKGMDIDILDQAFEMSPIKDRKPAYAHTMFYHFAFKNFKPWTKLSPRSVIATTSLDDALGYADQVYLMLPENGTPIHILPAPDLWLSFASTSQRLFGNKQSIIMQATALTKLSSDLLGRTVTWNESFLDTLKIIDKVKKEDREHWDATLDYHARKFDVSYIDRNGLLATVKKLFDIEKEITTVQRIEDLENFDSNEVWYDAHTLAVPYEFVEEFIEEIGKIV